MSAPDLSAVLRDLITTHDALMREVTAATLAAFERAIDAARVAHGPVLERSLARAARGRT